MAAGLEPGDRAAIWAPNIAEWIVAALGLHSAGGVLVPLNTRFKGHEAADIVDRAAGAGCCSPSPTSSTPTTWPCSAGAAGGPGQDRPVADLPALERIVVLRGDVPDGCQPGSDFLRSGDDDRRPRWPSARALAVEPDDLSDILFTSGTTGRPKGVMTAHGQNLRAFRDWAEVVGPARGRPLPDRQPVLPRLRLQGRHPGRADDGGDHPSPARVRRARGDGAGVARAHHHAARAADALPDDPQPPRLRQRSTCPRCASPSPARRPSRSS